MSDGKYLSILSSNVRGLRDANKRGDMWLYYKNMNADIICLQETHLVASDLHTITLEWNVDFFLSNSSTNSKGVAIILNNTFEREVIQEYHDKEGRFILIIIEIIDLAPILIANIYGPNKDDPSWYKKLFTKIDEYNIDHVILCGDWNTTLNNIDSYNYNMQRNLGSRNAINNYIKINDYIDIWRTQHKDSRRFTWGSKKPFKRSRLDYFLISDNIMAFAPKSEICNAYRSDHNIIKLNIKISLNSRGRGYWKFNNKLLQSQEYIEIIKKTINLAKLTYALPEYTEEFVKQDNGLNMEITIPMHLFINTLFCQIRGETIKFSKRQSRILKDEENKLIAKITDLENKIDKNNTNSEINKLEELNIKLEELRNNRLKGHQICSRYQHYKEWEKPSKYFLNLEKKNYLNKNITEIIDNNKKIINDPKKILKEQALFYRDLFSTKNTNIKDNTRYMHLLDNLPSISNTSKLSLEQEISLEELEEIIKTSKNNKAPGPDGFSNEFFKVFIDELKHWILKLYKESIHLKRLPDTILEGIITCIPKTGKERNSLKNWRPLTMLNSVYKFFSSILSKRIKDTLKQIINPDQTGFISERFIGENSRLLFDTLCYCEDNNIPGMLVIIDYAKAFDTIEWNFINYCLDIFGFGDFIKESVKLLQFSSFSRVEQNGHLSEKIHLTRGCRQGDPISPYLFVICAEVLSHVIRECKDVKGITIGDTEIKLSQYADDTTLLLNGDKNSLEMVIDILRWFNRMSGLGINKDKTKVVKIGALRDRRIQWEGNFGLEWTHTFVVLGIQYDVKFLKETTRINIESKINDIKKLIRTWSSRLLTPYGKVAIVKSLLLSKITHILLSLPSPEPDILKTIDNLFLAFIWNKKPAKFSKKILEAEIYNGGLKLHNLALFDQALKLGWLKRYLKSKGKWRIYVDLTDFHDIYKYGIDFTIREIEIAQVPFWRDVLLSLKRLWRSNVVCEISNILLTPLWYNDTLRFPIKPGWLDKGISIIADLLCNDCTFLSLEDFQLTYNIKTNFLEYGGFIKTLKYYLDNNDIPNTPPVRPVNSILNNILHRDSKGVSNLYKSMHPSDKNIIINLCQKWHEKGDLTFSIHDVTRSFTVTHSLVDDIYLRYIQFRTLHYRFFTNDILEKIKLKDSNICSMCKVSKDSNFHMLIECQCAQSLWTEAERWIRSLGMVNYTLTNDRKILGDLENSGQINIIILNIKKPIFLSKLDEKPPSLPRLKAYVRQSYLHDEYKYKIENKEHLFARKWSLLRRYYNKN